MIYRKHGAFDSAHSYTLKQVKLDGLDGQVKLELDGLRFFN